MSLSLVLPLLLTIIINHQQLTNNILLVGPGTLRRILGGLAAPRLILARIVVVTVVVIVIVIVAVVVIVIVAVVVILVIVIVTYMLIVTVILGRLGAPRLLGGLGLRLLRLLRRRAATHAARHLAARQGEVERALAAVGVLEGERRQRRHRRQRVGLGFGKNPRISCFYYYYMYIYIYIHTINYICVLYCITLIEIPM